MENEEKMSLIELLWRLSYQVVASSTKDRNDSKEDGSCFIINYRGFDILITADHVLHPTDFQEGVRGFEERYISVVTNISDNEKHISVLAKLGGFISYTQFNDLNTFQEYLKAEDIQNVIPDDMPDIAFAKYENPDHLCFITHELKDCQQNTLVPGGLSKGVIADAMFGDIPSNQDALYIVGGVVHNIENNGLWIRCNVLYCGLRYKETLPDGTIIMSYPDKVIYKNWAALSGSPVFNYQGDFVGMLLRVSEEYNHVVIIPVKLILKYIDLAIDANQL